MAIVTKKSFVLALVTLCLGIATASAEVVERVEVIINDQVITKTDVEDFSKRLKTGGLVFESLLRMNDPQVLMKDRKALVNHLVDERILDSEVKKKDLAVTFERVEQEIRNITKKNRITRAQLKQALGEKGVSFSEYQDFIKSSLERQSLIEREVTSKIKISDEDIAAFYAKKNGTAEVFQYQLAHIVMLPRNGGDEAAKERAEDVVRRLARGESFETLAKQRSEDPNFQEGGALGTFKSGEMAKEMEDAIKNLPVGEISGVVKAKMGYHILKLIKKTLVIDPELERQKDALHDQLFAQAFKSQFRNWLDQKRQEAFIRIN